MQRSRGRIRRVPAEDLSGSDGSSLRWRAHSFVPALCGTVGLAAYATASAPDPPATAPLAARAADLPAALLADLLGMHIHTAVRWVTYTRRDWTDYLAARAAERDGPIRDE